MDYLEVKTLFTNLKIMKKIFFLLVIIISVLHIHAQDYKLTFLLQGEVNTIDSVIVENVTQNTRIKLNGNDTLFLTKTTGINELQNSMPFNLKAYPNPTSSEANLEFTTSKPENIVARIFDMEGRTLITNERILDPGTHAFQVKNLPAGIYLVQLNAGNIADNVKIVSLQKGNNQPEFSAIKSESLTNTGYKTKSAAEAQLLGYKKYDNIVIRVWPTSIPTSRNFISIGIVMDEENPVMEENPLQEVTQTDEEPNVFVFTYVKCKDTCGNVYNTVQIGSQIWMAENFRCFTDSSWIYDDDESNEELYGRLYSWEDALNNAPVGWHLPSHEEWLEMEEHINNLYGEKVPLALKSDTCWLPNEFQEDTNGNDASGFNILPGGARWYINGTFYAAGESAYFWTSTKADSIRATIRKFTSSDSIIGAGNSNIHYGFSVRYIKDETANGGGDNGGIDNGGSDNGGGDNGGADNGGADNGGGDNGGGDKLRTPDFGQFGPYCEGNVPELPTMSPNRVWGTWSPDIKTANVGYTTFTFTPNENQNARSVTRDIEIEERINPTFEVKTNYPKYASIPSLSTLSKNGIHGKWSPAIDNKSTTTYTFTPNEGECADKTQITITITEDVEPTFNTFGPYCEGDETPPLPTISNNQITGTWYPDKIDNKQTASYLFLPDDGQNAGGVIIIIEIIPRATPTFKVKTSYPKNAEIPALPTQSIEGFPGTWTPEINNQETTTYTFKPLPVQCVDSFQLTITIEEGSIIPVFDAIIPYCEGDDIPDLPTTSSNGIEGTWSPAINNLETTEYTFTPNEGQNAISVTYTIEINKKVIPVFDVKQTYLKGNLIPDLPLLSLNNIPGTWQPAINNQETTVYTFTPYYGFCATTATLEIKIEDEVKSITDPRDGEVYPVVTIGDQVWMAANLRATKYNDGTDIPNVTDNTEWKELSSGAYCWFDNDISYKDVYGALYNWYTVNTDKLCPAGWHVPSDDEWTTLDEYYGRVAAGKLKEEGTSHWKSPNTGATNASGFTALPGGYRYYLGSSFSQFGNAGFWWSSTEISPNAWYRYMTYSMEVIIRNNQNKNSGYSVRCIKD